jgi:hypothetical protein
MLSLKKYIFSKKLAQKLAFFAQYVYVLQIFEKITTMNFSKSGNFFEKIGKNGRKL